MPGKSYQQIFIRLFIQMCAKNVGFKPTTFLNELEAKFKLDNFVFLIEIFFGQVKFLENEQSSSAKWAQKIDQIILKGKKRFQKASPVRKPQVAPDQGSAPRLEGREDRSFAAGSDDWPTSSVGRRSEVGTRSPPCPGERGRRSSSGRTRPPRC